MLPFVDETGPDKYALVSPGNTLLLWQAYSRRRTRRRRRAFRSSSTDFSMME